MSLSQPISKILKLKLPAVLTVALVAGQYLVFGQNSEKDPRCGVKVDKPHHSTYLKEFADLDAIKVNVTVTCTVNQEFAIIDVQLMTKINNSPEREVTFKRVKGFPSSQDRKITRYQNIFIPCKYGKQAMYLSRIVGEVHLAQGGTKGISGDSGKIQSANCQLIAE